MGGAGNGSREASEHVLGVGHINHLYSTQYLEASICLSSLVASERDQGFRKKCELE